MVYSPKWIPSPWSRREQQLRKIMDQKNKRDRKRKDKKRWEQEQALLAETEMWLQEGSNSEATGSRDGAAQQSQGQH